MTKIQFTKKTAKLVSVSDEDINIDLEIKPFSFDTTGFESTPSSVVIKNIRFVESKSKYQEKGLDILLDADKKKFELEFDENRTQFWIVRGHMSNFDEPGKLHIKLYTGSNYLTIGSPSGFLSDIATLTSLTETPPLLLTQFVNIVINVKKELFI